MSDQRAYTPAEKKPDYRPRTCSKSRLARWLVLNCLMVIMAFLCRTSSAQRAIPDDNLAYPVLITLSNGSSGSGFYLNSPDAVYLVTAKHVLFNPTSQQLLDSRAESLSYSKDLKETTRNLLTLDLSALQASGNIKRHPTEDVVVVKLFDNVPITSGEHVGQEALRPVAGVMGKEAAKAGLVGVSLAAIKRFDQVLTGNDVMLFGYPSSLGLQQMSQLDLHHPLLRKGIVAGTNPEKRAIILDCPVYFGNSGGPVLELDRDGSGTNLRIIGVVIEYVPFVQTGGSQTFVMQMVSNSGYSIAVPMDFVLELIK